MHIASIPLGAILVLSIDIRNPRSRSALYPSSENYFGSGSEADRSSSIVHKTTPVPNNDLLHFSSVSWEVRASWALRYSFASFFPVRSPYFSTVDAYLSADSSFGFLLLLYTYPRNARSSSSGVSEHSGPASESEVKASICVLISSLQIICFMAALGSGSMAAEVHSSQLIGAHFGLRKLDSQELHRELKGK